MSKRKRENECMESNKKRKIDKILTNIKGVKNPSSLDIIENFIDTIIESEKKHFDPWLSIKFFIFYLFLVYIIKCPLLNI